MLLETVVRLFAGALGGVALGAAVYFSREAVQGYREGDSAPGELLFVLAILGLNGLLSLGFAIGGLKFLCAC